MDVLSDLSDNKSCRNDSAFNLGETLLSDSKALLFAVSLCLSCLSAFTVFTNVLVIAAVCYSYTKRSSLGVKQNYEKSNVKLLMASLAAGDAIIGGCFMPLGIVNVIHNGQWTLPGRFCRYFTMMDVAFCTASIYHVMFMAVDRYLAICRPLVHRLLTIKSGLVMAGLCWIVPTVLMCFAVTFNLMSTAHFSFACEINACYIEVEPLYSVGGSVITILLPFAVICVLYLLVLCEVNRFHKRKPKALGIARDSPSAVECSTDNIKSCSLPCETVQSEANSKSSEIRALPASMKNSILKEKETFDTDCQIQTNVSFNAVSQHENVSPERTEHIGKKKRQILKTIKQSGRGNKNKAFLTIGLLVFSFAVCWCPFALLLCLQKLGKGSDLSFASVTSVAWLCYLNSTFNPLLFCCHRGMRTALKTLLRIGSGANKPKH